MRFREQTLKVSVRAPDTFTLQGGWFRRELHAVFPVIQTVDQAALSLPATGGLSCSIDLYYRFVLLYFRFAP